MANREELLIIRAARAGQAAAQLSLGKRYLFGSSGLPKSLPTALYWLDRAAQQDEQDAWLLIGSHVPFETVQQATQPARLYVWYERAFDAGVAQAGLVLARLVLGQPDGAVSDAMRSKALRALQAAAHAGIAEAQWLLAQIIGAQPDKGVAHWPGAAPAQADDNQAMLEWATRAAKSGVVDAQYALAEHAWTGENRAEFLHWGLPLARRLIEHDVRETPTLQRDIDLAVRCAHVLYASGEFDAAEVTRLLEFAAEAGDRDAQLALGLWLARMDSHGQRVTEIPGLANYKKAIRWLTQAGRQGLADAWYALSKVYLKPECSQRSVTEAQRYLDMAAQAGHGLAQLELGEAAWRARREHESNDVRAVGWLLKAQAQGIAEATRQLEKITSPAVPAAWAQDALERLGREAAIAHPLLAARLQLAASFGLSRTEALLIDPKAADRGHCFVVDVRVRHPHSKRRLIPVQTAVERQLLDRLTAVFERVDCGPGGPEGNYRQRLYRLKTLAADKTKLA
jgi:TPR repeat protein